MLQNLVTEALYTLHRSGSVIMLIYEKVKETTAHLPSDRPIKNKHLEVSCNNVAPVTNLCLDKATTRSHSSQWSKKKIAVET